MFIPVPFLDVKLECAECTSRPNFTGTPYLLHAHLQQAHRYTIEEATDRVINQVDTFPQDEGGNPLLDCDEHGPYPYQEMVCPGCDAVEQDIDEAIERSHR